MAAAADLSAHHAFLADCFTDYRKFCGLLQIITKDNGRQQFVLNPIQKKRIARRTGRDIVLKARQVGMTTEECARDIWHFLTRRGARVVVVVQSITGNGPLKQVAGILRCMLDGLRSLGLDLGITKETNVSWEIASRDAQLTVIEAGATEATAQKKGRSGMITRLHATEIAFWEHAEATLLAMLQCVPKPETGSEIVFESTPNGAAGTFFDRCQAAQRPGSTYRFVFFAWYENPDYRAELSPGETITPQDERERQLVGLGCTPEQLKWRRRQIADELGGKADLFDQEYPSDPQTCFLIKGRTFFNKLQCVALLRLCKPELAAEQRGRLRVWEHAKPGVEYVIGVDTSEGIEEPGLAFDRQPHDACAAIVRKRGTGEHVATLWGYLRPDELGEAAANLGKRYNTAVVAVERNNHGHAVLLKLKELKYPKVFCDDDGREGWVNSGPRRTAALDVVEAEHRKGPPYYSTPDSALVGQQSTFVVSKKGKAEASPGAHDDLVLADAITWNVLNRARPPRGMGDQRLGML